METKECTKCHETKNKTDFSITKRYCKACAIIMVSSYRKTKRGIITNMHARQKTSSKLRGHDTPKYTYLELIEWFDLQPNFNRLFTAWVNSGYLSKLKPSVDRINDNKGYSFDNIQLMTWEENNKKTRPTERIDILMYNKSNKLIKHFDSATTASNELNICRNNIVAVLNKRRPYAGGYKWEYR